MKVVAKIVNKAIINIIETNKDRVSEGFLDSLEHVVKHYDLKGKDKERVLGLQAHSITNYKYEFEV